jgi:hypothetical protein
MIEVLVVVIPAVGPVSTAGIPAVVALQVYVGVISCFPRLVMVYCA